MIDDWNGVEWIFAAALEQPAAERSAFLDAVCAGRPEIRSEVDSLLAHHRADKDFLGRPALQALAGELSPFQAREPSLAYLATTIARRHRAAVVAAVVSFVALTGALGISLWEVRLARAESR